MTSLPYYHVDVFSDKPLSGNGLIVFTETAGLTPELMLRLTQEMRQFESIFIKPVSDTVFAARVFTCEEELDFAGHPVLGAAAVLHNLYRSGVIEFNWEIQLNKKTVQVHTIMDGALCRATMNQGTAEFGYTLTEAEAQEMVRAMNLTMRDLHPGLMPVVVSTGLPYLILPLQQNALKAKISIPDLEEKLQPFGAKFIGTLDIPSLSIRTWDNAGLIEDIATGSLAGPGAAYLVQQGFQKSNTVFQLNQGHNLGRPSQLFVEVGASGNVMVGGSVCRVGYGVLESGI